MPNQNVDAKPTGKQRRVAVAVILAQAVLRYQRRIGRLVANSSDSLPRGLEVLGETRLSVSERTAG
jgi:hypothetical protein